MDEQRVIRHGILNQPVHGSDHVGLGWLAHRVLLVIGQDDHVFPAVPIHFVQEDGHLRHVVDTSPKLIGLAKVVDAY